MTVEERKKPWRTSNATVRKYVARVHLNAHLSCRFSN